MNYYKISAGLGPIECHIAVTELFHHICWNHKVDIIEESHSSVVHKDYDYIFKEVLIRTADDLSDYVGTIQYIFKSPIRENHKRKNWFIKVYEYSGIDRIKIDESKIEFSTTRSSGAGGQHVNTTDSCVILNYIPLNIQIRCSAERSQYQNKKTAVDILRMKIHDLNIMNESKSSRSNWKQSIDIERGNPVKTFKI